MFSVLSQRQRILFVCLGNICRSPSAEVILRTTAARAGLGQHVRIDSAGTGDWHVGNPPDYRATAHAAKRGYDLRPLRARQFCAEDFDRFDWIFAMDQSVLDDLVAMKPAGFAGHLGLFLDRAPEIGERNVPDPYDKGPEGFERVLDLLEQGSEAFTAELARYCAK